MGKSLRGNGETEHDHHDTYLELVRAEGDGGNTVG